VRALLPPAASGLQRLAQLPRVQRRRDIEQLVVVDEVVHAPRVPVSHRVCAGTSHPTCVSAISTRIRLTCSLSRLFGRSSSISPISFSADSSYTTTLIMPSVSYDMSTRSGAPFGYGGTCIGSSWMLVTYS